MSRCYNKWTAEEKEQLRKLLDYYEKHQTRPDWRHIARRIGTKDERQCYGHYATAMRQPQLEPVARHYWTPAEEQELASVFKLFPFQWERIQEHFPSLTVSQLKNKVNSLKFGGALDAWAEQAGTSDKVARRLQQLWNGLQ